MWTPIKNTLAEPSSFGSMYLPYADLAMNKIEKNGAYHLSKSNLLNLEALYLCNIFPN